MLILSPTYSHWWNSTARFTKHGLVWGLLFFVVAMFDVSSIVLSRTCPIYSFIFKTGTENCSLCIASISAAFAGLEAFLFCLKKWCSGDEIDIEAEEVFYHIDFAVLFEAVLESAPQFIIQLYAISVQEEPAAIIQTFHYLSLFSLWHGPSQPLIRGFLPRTN